MVGKLRSLPGERSRLEINPERFDSDNVIIQSMTKSIIAITALACGSLWAQTPPAFEVASVKPSAAMTGVGIRFGMKTDRGGVTIEGMPLKMILARAYKVRTNQINGPDWLETERFDISAKLPEGAKPDQVPEMLQALLAERFKLVMHKEQKTAPIYAMVLGKGGLKAKEAEAPAADAKPSGVRIMMGPKGRKLEGEMTLAGLAGALANTLDRPVIDETGTKGTFKIVLEWSPEAGEGGMMGMRMQGPPAGGGAPPQQAEMSADAPPIFVAVQEQLGLRMDARKGPVDYIVIDKIEKVQTEN